VEIDTEEFNRILASNSVNISNDSTNKNPISKNMIISNSHNNINSNSNNILNDKMSLEQTSFNGVNPPNKIISTIPLKNKNETLNEELNRNFKEKFLNISEEIMGRSFVKMIDHYKNQNKFEYTADFELLAKKLSELK